MLAHPEQVAHPFAPIGDERSRALILGTMPSVRSRGAAFYYGHPRNRFWRVMAACFDWSLPEGVEEKARLLLGNGVALWDVLASCEIVGSGDASIRRPVCNDIAAFVANKPVAGVLCNGSKAYELYIRYCSVDLPVVCMPSTSPANASWSVERLVEAWRAELRRFSAPAALGFQERYRVVT